MTPDEANEFVYMIDGAWTPPLTDVQKTFWLDLCTPLDAKAAFMVLVAMFKTEAFRPKPPVYMDAYHRELRDRTPLYLGPQDRDEMPDWVGGWRIARAEGDERIWPEEEAGARALHEWWIEEVGEKFVKEHGLKSGYEWTQLVHDQGLMPQQARLDYMERFKKGEGPRSIEAATAVGRAIG